MQKDKMLQKGFVILNYNDCNTTAALIRHMRSSGITDAICVVDNCSKDESYDRLIQLDFENCVVLRSEENRGYAAGNNIGCRYLIDTGKADIVFIANPDIEFSKETVDKIVSLFAQNDDYAILTPLMYKPDGSVSDRPFIRLPSYFQDLMLCFYFYNRIYEKKYAYSVEQTAGIIDVDAAPGSFFAIRAEALKQVDYLDEGTFLYYEEMILAMKMRNCSRRWKIGLVPSLDYIHHHSVSIRNSLSVMNSYKIYMNSKMYFEKKYHRIGIVKQKLLRIAIMISCAEEWGILHICGKN